MTTQNYTLEQFYAEIKPNNGVYGYSLKIEDTLKMRGGIAWVASLMNDGRKVGVVECDGDGGCYSYHFDDKVERVLFNTAIKMAYNGRVMVDVEEDCFINWLDRPKGIN